MSDTVAYPHAAQQAGQLLKFLPIKTFFFPLGMGEFSVPVLLVPRQGSWKAFLSTTTTSSGVTALVTTVNTLG